MEFLMVRIRLKRMGRKRKPFYRVVAADQRSPRDGRHIEVLGYYNPMTEPLTIELKMDRVNYWIGVGAQPSDTAASLIKRYNAKSEGADS
jgi:small subunit ribosomal protein S16